jgi:hypothetical protein
MFSMQSCSNVVHGANKLAQQQSGDVVQQNAGLYTMRQYSWHPFNHSSQAATHAGVAPFHGCTHIVT